MCQLGGWAKSIKIRPGQDGEKHPFGEFVTERMATVAAWREKDDPEYDYGVIELDESIGEETGWFSLASRSRETLQNKYLNVCGYPADRGGQTQWFSRSTVEQVEDNRVYYSADTYGGMSGGPAWISNRQGEHSIVAIHTNGRLGTPSSIKREVNSATRITPPVLNNIEHWRNNGL